MSYGYVNLNNRFYYGIKTGLNEAFVIDREKRDELIRDRKCAKFIKPFLRGKDLRRWRPEYGDQWLIVIPSSENAEHPWSGQRQTEAEKTFQRELPAIYDHFKPLRSKLIARADQGKYYWELRSCAYYEEFGKPKVIYQEINRTDAYAYDDSGLYMNNKLFMLPEAPIWLVAILNSPVATFYFHRSTGVPKGGFLALQWPVFSPFPVADPGPKRSSSLSNLVILLRYLTTYFTDRPDEQSTRDPLLVAYCEQVLNGLVYELYFPSEMQAAGLRIFALVEKVGLPDIETIPDGKRLSRFRQLLEALYEAGHPLRIALDKLQTLDTIRIIEGKG